VDTLIVKTVDYEVLKTHIYSVKISHIRKNQFSVSKVSKTNFETIVLWVD